MVGQVPGGNTSIVIGDPTLDGGGWVNMSVRPRYLPPAVQEAAHAPIRRQLQGPEVGEVHQIELAGED
ncbi:hypothetical protein NKDENANG_01198 [Candidatus Entotheonellaceae bacterium PAL068K]